MVVHSGDACLADAAVLAPRWLQELASRARVAWVVQHPVIRVVPHLVCVVQRVDIRLVIALGTEVEEGVRLR